MDLKKEEDFMIQIEYMNFKKRRLYDPNLIHVTTLPRQTANAL